MVWWWGTLIIFFDSEKQPARANNIIVNFSLRLKLWFAVGYFKNTSALTRSACSYITAVAAFGNAQSEAQGESA